MTGTVASPTTQPTAIAQYQRLRAAMLGEALPPDARSGLIVFLHRGMWRWVRMLLPEPARLETIPARFSPSRSPTPTELIEDREGEDRTIIGLLAGMAMASNDRRPP
jgi:hypothetical protein